MKSRTELAEEIVLALLGSKHPPLFERLIEEAYIIADAVIAARPPRSSVPDTPDPELIK